LLSLRNLFIFSALSILSISALAQPGLPPLECEQWGTYQLIESSNELLSPALPAKFDQLIVSKSERTLIAFANSQPIKSYSVALGQQPLGAKTQDGDLKTPEGQYYIEGKNPNSAYYLALQVSYPSTRDKAMAMVNGVKPGGQIMLHGFPVNAQERLFAEERHSTTKDWTQGCVAVTNNEIREIYKRVDVETPILICP
jgi:murein L,D-transpeptidase YafK